MNKKTKLAILGVIALVLVTLSLTYAYWIITRTQIKENVITAGCLDISLTNEQNDISLTEQFPISDDEGKELTPYTFTVTNNCNTAVDYNVNLEVLGDKNNNMASSSIKVMLDEEAPTLLGLNYEEEEQSADAYASYRIGFGTLTSKGTATHNIRLWIDEEAPISEMNKTFSSKVSLTAGQGINNPIKEGTLAYDLVSQYNKDNATILNAKWYEEIGELRNDISVQENRMHEWSNSYIFDDTTGTHKLSGDIIKATIEECRSKTKKCGKYYHPAGGYGVYLVESLTSDRYQAGLTFITARFLMGTSVFDKGGQEDIATLHKAPDDYGISYYLRGDVTNNYVEFGTYKDATTITSVNDEYDEVTEIIPAGAKMYWRIIRINGDGTIRMIYDGISKKENCQDGVSDIGKTVFNEDDSEYKYTGYTYANDSGEQEDSFIKDLVDTWYEDNLKTNYEKYIADRIFCNNRENITDEYYCVSESRLMTEANPKLSCANDEDKYTVSAKNGNGYLNNPVGLITADEVLLAGSAPYQYANSYLVRNGGSWTMSPEISDCTITSYTFDSGYIDSMSAINDDTYTTARPVINLKADVKFTGNGSYETPYVITTN